jgi:hypothetical protein
MRILSEPMYQAFGPTPAAEQLAQQHHIEASRETVRQWMMRAKLWRGKKAKVAQVHQWRPRRSRFGELVQWDTSDHDWLEGRGERLYPIAMIDHATSRLIPRFVRHDSREYVVAMELPGKVWAAPEFLYAEGESFFRRRTRANGMSRA